MLGHSSSPTAARPGMRIVASYAIDWIATILLAGLLAIINSVYGYRRQFSLTDTSIQHTYSEHERVPTWLLAVCAFVIPAGIIAAVGLGVRKSLWDFHSGFLGLVLTNALTLTITTLVKVSVGRPRPDLIDRCQPMAGAHDATPYGLSTQAICTIDLSSHVLRDGFRSFPSGHASTSFAGLTFLSLYLAGKIHLFDSRGHALGAWVVILPLVGATLIAVSRSMDYRHHASDLIAGALLGFWISVAIYFMYFPSLTHPQAHKPWAPRVYKAIAGGDWPGYERFDAESADRPGGIRRPHFSHDEGRGAEDWRPLPTGAQEEYAYQGSNAHVGGLAGGGKYDGGAGPAQYAPVIGSHSRGPSGSAEAASGRRTKVPAPIHATGPRTDAHGYQAPVYADASTLGRGGGGDAHTSEFASPARPQGRYDADRDVELAVSGR
ncbi:hypothetical protein OC846_003381 [Tilletia horrida]|uniref:Phosphatidic acid phosphatase type 2/haloperoxidase domain-containing protein n=1 Tax=Tilletia horrida TaxID=155126 RepID=A0AAN6GSL9_9BASI|nr:hypothetical protein OC845_005751 [Tilletia horrida]KAK0551242.1 hypothetical protein OC846_003381 [Tilletia horrida]KAK0561619.1 hypothetical protein OC861_005733 [Tilletia horrida]